MNRLMYPVGPVRAFSLMPADLWFEIVDYLPVIVVVRLRRVSRQFHRIVSSPVVWKRLMRRLHLHLPHQPQSIASMTAEAVERLVKRAILLHINWQQDVPRAKKDILSSVERPYMVRILPGGRWLVAATKSAEDESFAVVVWDLENPEERGGGCALLAKCRTRTAINHLTVRYMLHDGKMGIVIATLRSIGEKPSTKTEVCVIHITLEALDALSRDQRLPDPPFKLVELHKSHCQIAYMSIEGTILSMVHRPRTIMFLDLQTKKSAQLKLQHSNDREQRHSIQACKLIPSQNHVLVIRLIYTGEHTSYAFELHDLPAWDSVVREPQPVSFDSFPEVPASSFVISECVRRQSNSDHPTEQEMMDNCHYASPISIFAHTMGPKGIIHYQLMPKLVRPSAIRAMPALPSLVVPNMIGQNPTFSSQLQTGPQTGPFNLLLGHTAPIASMPFFPLTTVQMGGFPLQLLNPQSMASLSAPTDPSSNEMDLAMDDGTEDLSEPLRPYYSLPVIKKAHYWFEENDQKPTVLPGSDRSVFWTRPMETRADYPPMRNLLAYMTKAPRVKYKHPTGLHGEGNERVFEDYADWEYPIDHYADMEEGRTDPAPLPDDRRLKQLTLPPEFVDAVQLGTLNAAFDEGSGKLCIVAGRPAKVYFLDYAV
ncbi:hypothetical protein FS842_001242 [Serendipita sp. 407]|nr:hypothetical protein FS842_001242 [Serendipita sp. 407]